MYIKIKLETFLEILYFLNWLLKNSSLGGGGDFGRLSRLVWKMYNEGVFEQMPGKDTIKFPTMASVVKDFKRMQKIEEGGS